MHILVAVREEPGIIWLTWHDYQTGDTYEQSVGYSTAEERAVLLRILQDDEMLKSHDLTDEQAERAFKSMFKECPPVVPASLRARKRTWLKPATRTGRKAAQEAA